MNIVKKNPLEHIKSAFSKNKSQVTPNGGGGYTSFRPTKP